MENKHTKTQSRKQRRHQANKDAIIQAAQEVFARKGYHKATIEQIAGQADFATGTIYNFFPGKYELYEEVILRIGNNLLQKLENEVFKQSDPVHAVKKLIEVRFKHYQENKTFFRVILEMAPAGRFEISTGMPESCSRLYEDYIKKVTEIFRKGVNQGHFDKFDPLYLTLSLEGIINSFVTYWSRHEPEEKIEQRIDNLQSMFISRIKIKLIDQQANL